MRIAPLALALATCLVLAGCGDDGGNPGKPLTPEDMGLPADFDPNDPEAVKDMVTGFTRSIADAELNDDVLDELYAIHEKVLEVDGNPAKAMAAFKDTAWNMATYAKAMLKFEALRTAQRRGVDRVRKQLDDAKAEMARLEADVKQATGDAQTAAVQKLASIRVMLPILEERAKMAGQLADPKVRELIERWGAKFDALEDR